ncbi:MAG: 50S ribosomal protein L10 [Nitrospinota bacterium]|nr:50S ribosomal protein L10 [Nitrospinota bacterium]HJM43022.1 50S ribosomal protein L10 [Nitrospinota bacterium]
MATAVKEKKVAEIRERFENARGAILADFRGLNVSEITELRRTLKANQAEMRVVKNRLVRLAVRETPFSILEKEFQGPTAVTFCDGEMIEPARELSKFAAAHPALEIKCGVFDGDLIDGSEVERIAKLPPREVLLAQLFGTLQGPITGLVRALNGVLVNLVVKLSAIRDQKSGS